MFLSSNKARNTHTMCLHLQFCTVILGHPVEQINLRDWVNLHLLFFRLLSSLWSSPAAAAKTLTATTWTTMKKLPRSPWKQNGTKSPDRSMTFQDSTLWMKSSWKCWEREGGKKWRCGKIIKLQLSDILVPLKGELIAGGAHLTASFESIQFFEHPAHFSQRRTL